jgi:glycosyltransferase involved in cell wall biosynthesis
MAKVLCKSELSIAQMAYPASRPLLVFAYYFPPMKESGGQRPFRFARYLLRHNYQARIITASPQGDSPPWAYAAEAAPTVRMAGQARILHWIARVTQRALPYNDQLSWVVPALLEAEKAIAETRPLAIMSTSPPVACHVAALALKARYGLPWIADFRDPLYRNPHRSRMLTRPYEAVLEDLILRYADAVIANTDSAEGAMRRHHPDHAHKIHLIWNGYDPELALTAAPLPKRAFKLVLHAGSLYAGRHPGSVVASLARLIDRGRLNPATVRLRQIGSIEWSQPWISRPEFSRLRELDCLEYVDRMLPEPEAIREMAQSDYLLLLDCNEAGVALQVPAKLFQYIRIGRPILAVTPDASPSERILARSGIPFVATDQNAPDHVIDERVANLLNMSSEPRQPSTWFESQFDAIKQTQALASILQAVSSE